MTKRKNIVLIMAVSIVFLSQFCFNNAGADSDQCYILTISESNIGAGYVNVNDTISVMSVPSQFTCSYDDIFRITAVAASGWNFSGWTGDITNSNNELTITMDSNITITAMFEQNGYYTIEANQSANGTIIPSTASYAAGSNQDFTITPDKGYFIESITLDHKALNVASLANQTVSIKDIQADHIITATYAPCIYNLTVFTVGHGSVTPNNGTYSYGDSVTLAAASDNGYLFTNWNDNSINNTITIVIHDNENFTATFAQIPSPSPTPIPTPAPAPSSSPTPSTNSSPQQNTSQTSPSPTTAPNPTSNPNSNPSSVSTGIPTLTPAPTNQSPKPKTNGVGEYFLIIAAGIILAVIASGIFLRRKKRSDI
jgi:uncharacterized repeat protein (TIGR02543 family)/LPXTG-motif cell wall-anchored protein